MLSKVFDCPHADHRKSIRQQSASMLYRRFHHCATTPKPDQPAPRTPRNPQTASPPGMIKPTHEANIGTAASSTWIDQPKNSLVRCPSATTVKSIAETLQYALKFIAISQYGYHPCKIMCAVAELVLITQICLIPKRKLYGITMSASGRLRPLTVCRNR